MLRCTAAGVPQTTNVPIVVVAIARVEVSALLKAPGGESNAVDMILLGFKIMATRHRGRQASGVTI